MLQVYTGNNNSNIMLASSPTVQLTHPVDIASILGLGGGGEQRRQLELKVAEHIAGKGLITPCEYASLHNPKDPTKYALGVVENIQLQRADLFPLAAEMRNKIAQLGHVHIRYSSNSGFGDKVILLGSLVHSILSALPKTTFSFDFENQQPLTFRSDRAVVTNKPSNSFFAITICENEPIEDKSDVLILGGMSIHKIQLFSGSTTTTLSYPSYYTARASHMNLAKSYPMTWALILELGFNPLCALPTATSNSVFVKDPLKSSAPFVVLNLAGGENYTKGFIGVKNPNNTLLQKVLDYILEAAGDKKIILLPTDRLHGFPTEILSTLNSLGLGSSYIGDRITLIDQTLTPSNRVYFDNICAAADQIYTVEGGLMHYGLQLGVPVTALLHAQTVNTFQTFAPFFAPRDRLKMVYFGAKSGLGPDYVSQ